jgi:hypothetical protein
LVCPVAAVGIAEFRWTNLNGSLGQLPTGNDGRLSELQTAMFREVAEITITSDQQHVVIYARLGN